MKTFIIIAFRNIVQSKTRSLMIGLAIMFVTTIMLVLSSITSGIKDTILENATSLSSGHINIAGFYKLSLNSAAPVVTHRALLREIAKDNIPEAKLIIERVKAWGKLISDQETIQVPMWGVDIVSEENVLVRLPTASGDIRELSKRGTMVLFESHAKKLKVKVGDMITISMPTNRNISNTKDVKIVAILRDMGLMSSFNTFMNHDDTREIYQMSSESTGQIMIYLKDLKDLATVENRLRKIFQEKKFRLMEKDPQPFWMKFDKVAGESWTGQKIDITTWEDETSFLKWILDIFDAITLVLTSVLLLIVILGLMNTLWISIRERTGEIGTLRAIGLQKRQVITIFMLEAFILSFISSLVGIILGSILSIIIHLMRISINSDAIRMFLMSDTLNLSVHPENILSAFFFICFFITLSALYPSYRASQMKPITAMGQIE